MTIDWHADWSASRVHWPDLFRDLGLIGQPNLRFLEIGVFEGGSAHWTLTNVLTDPASRLVMIDPIEFDEIGGEPQQTRIDRHLGAFFDSGQASLAQGRSEDVLRGWTDEWADLWERDEFDFIYIDGDHFPAGVLKDAVLTWPLLKPGAAMLFDDYLYELGGHRGPRHAIDAFAHCYVEEIADQGPVGPDQYLIKKLP